jgi:hypothetical protein
MTTRTFSTLVSCLATALPCLFGCGRANLGSEQAVGRPCNLGITAGPSEAAFNASAAECPTNLCVKPANGLGAPIPSTTATCTGECTQDSDCDGELRDVANPGDTRCMSGFACGIPFEVGPLACKRMCMCRDFLGPQGAATPMACLGGAPITPIASLPTGTGEVTTSYVPVNPLRQVDIVALIDNTATMAPKVAKFTAQLPKLIDALKSPTTGALPDVHLAVLDSDLGTGGTQAAGACGPKLLADGTTSLYGDMGRFQMRTTPTACPVLPGAGFLQSRAGLPVNYTGDLGAAFSCLVGNLGSAGCGYTHQLQALEFGLVAGGIGNEAQQQTFLRPDAKLGLILLTDQDDCSAATNDGMFADIPGLAGESLRLRCATRAHACSGVNLATGTPGYPTVASYVSAFSECTARTDACPNPTDGDPNSTTDTSLPTSCSPLKSIHRLADEIKRLKSHPDQQILVAGIFGWPRTAADMTAAPYAIAPVPNPNPADPAHPTVFDLWPVCYDPNHLPSPATTDPLTGFDATAAAWGATGGLRESAFIDEFGANGLKFSICEPDFSATMLAIGGALAQKLDSPCLGNRLLDLDPVEPGVQADCKVAYLRPGASFGDVITYVVDASFLPRCPAGAIDGVVTEDCWQLESSPLQCPTTGQGISLLRTAANIAAGPLTEGTKLKLLCQACPVDALSGGAGCTY